VDLKDIRNLALVGHGASGKTTLVDCILLKAKVASRQGSVDDGTSLSDFDEVEKEKQFSIDTSIFNVERGGKRLNILDAPGYPDFSGAAIAALEAVETAVVVVSAPAGVEINARKMWDQATRRGLARAVVINKMDGENIEYEALMASVGDAFGSGCVCVNVPVGSGAEFSGVVGVMDEDASGDGCVVDPADARERLMDAIVETDDSLMERYLEGEALSPEEITAALQKALASGALVPVLHTSARKGIGVEELMDFMAMAAPSPVDGKVRTVPGTGEEDEPVEIECDAGGALVAQIFKVMTDPFVGKLTFFRVLRGKVTVDGALYNARADSASRPAQLVKVQGAKQEQVGEVAAGDIGAVSKIEDSRVGDTFSDRKTIVACEPIKFPQPMVSLAVEPKSRGDEGRISTAMGKIADEDPTFRTNRDAQTHEMVISGLSSLHLDIILLRLARRFQVEVVTKDPKIAYRETILGKSESRYRHKKQTGGRGQFAEVAIRVAPTERGAGFQFHDEIVGGSIPNNYIPAVEKGIRQTMERGVIAGYLVVDVGVHCWDGKFHDVDSSEAAFKLAASRAFQDAFKAAKPALLEPIVTIEVTANPDSMGDITGDLNGRRGRIQGMESVGGMQVIKAQVPMSEITHYATELRSMTGGTASYTMEFSHYDVVPAHEQQKIVAAVKVKDEE